MHHDGDPLTPAHDLAGAIERLSALLRHLSPGGMSLTAAATLATLARSGPIRLTRLAAAEGVTQPAMTQLVTRMERQGLATRTTDPDDGRAVLIALTDDGRTELARRRAARTERLTEMLAELSPTDQLTLADARPALEALIRLAAPRPEGEPA